MSLAHGWHPLETVRWLESSTRTWYGINVDIIINNLVIALRPHIYDERTSAVAVHDTWLTVQHCLHHDRPRVPQYNELYTDILKCYTDHKATIANIGGGHVAVAFQATTSIEGTNDQHIRLTTSSDAGTLTVPPRIRAIKIAFFAPSLITCIHRKDSTYVL